MSDLPFAIDRTSRRPLARQVADGIREVCAQGLIRVGDRLPSTRALAKSLQVSRTVTEAAYDQLHAEGWIISRRGSGTFVAAVPSAIDPELVVASTPVPPTTTVPSIRPVAAEGVVFRSRVRQLAENPPEADGEGPDLRPGAAWAAGVPPEIWRRAWRRAGDTPPDARHLRAGLPEFRTTVVEHLLRHRGLAMPGSSVLATAGTTAAILELAMAAFERGTTVAVEEPGYPRAVAAFQAAGMRVVAVPVDTNGLLVDAIPTSTRVVYCTPAHQFPLGGRLPAARRAQLVAWARQAGALIVEDDYDGELRYDVAPLPLLASIGPDVVIHLGTASKLLSPTLSVGWMVAPRAVRSAVLAYRDISSASPGLAGQRVLAAMAEAGDLPRHLRRIRRELSARRDLVAQTLAEAGVPVTGDRAGSHVAVLLDRLVDEERLVGEAAHAGVRIDGLRRCFTGSPWMFGAALGYAAPEHRAELEEGLRVLVNVLAQRHTWA
ncbi:PLP-dependent aminotransferase family protein [Phytoactinopolyspora limicola]|uniref:MocR-like pyridoxine biosynthesis transcription factor PdxR n=1 Tax=Phytoactinopolyspora limicola TaxID=2715536 RepID=UPI001409CFBA|nr:PLP-dependent aminotransferase family protein [Phytoactinopolyspora limicola]